MIYSKIRNYSWQNNGASSWASVIPDTLFDVHLHEVFGGLGYFVTSKKIRKYRLSATEPK